MKGVKSYLAWFMIFALLVSTAQAGLIINKVTDEFSVESPYPVHNLKACQCSKRTDILEIKNIGDFEALFKVEIYSPIKDLITLSDDTFELAPGEDNKVYVYIEVPCDAPLNTYYTAVVRTNYGRSKEIYKEVVSSKCQSIKFENKVVNGQILPGEITTIQIDLQNVGDFTDTFKITPELYKEFTVLSQDEVSLAPDEQKKVFMYVKFPLSQYGKIDFPFTITSEKSQNIVRGVQSFSIERDYDFSIKTDALEMDACEDVSKEAKLTITNLANTPNKYYLQLIGPSFVKLSQDSFELEAGKENTVSIIITPTEKEIGAYDLVLKARTEYGDMYKEKSFKLRVNKCFASGATLEGYNEIVSDKACCGEKIFTLNIRNNGLYEEAYEINTESPG